VPSDSERKDSTSVRREAGGRTNCVDATATQMSSESAPADSISTLAGLLPEALFDMLARILPGLIFLILIYVSAVLGTPSGPAVQKVLALSTLLRPLDSFYKFIFLVAIAYVAGFLIEMFLGLYILRVSEALLHPAVDTLFGSEASTEPTVTAGVGRYLRRSLLRGMSAPLDQAVADRIKDAARRLLKRDLTTSNIGDLTQVVFDYIKVNQPALSLVLLKIHAEAWMFKNLAAASLLASLLAFPLALATELPLHRFANLPHLLIFTLISDTSLQYALIFTLISVLISIVAYRGFLNLHFLWHRRLYESFLAVASVNLLPQGGKKEQAQG